MCAAYVCPLPSKPDNWRNMGDVGELPSRIVSTSAPVENAVKFTSTDNDGDPESSTTEQSRLVLYGGRSSSLNDAAETVVGPGQELANEKT